MQYKFKIPNRLDFHTLLLEALPNTDDLSSALKSIASANPTHGAWLLFTDGVSAVLGSRVLSAADCNSEIVRQAFIEVIQDSTNSFTLTASGGQVREVFKRLEAACLFYLLSYSANPALFNSPLTVWAENVFSLLKLEEIPEEPTTVDELPPPIKSRKKPK